MHGAAAQDRHKHRVDDVDRLAAFVAGAPAGIAMFDSDMRYLAASPRFAEQLRIAPDRLIGRSHYEAFSDVPERWRRIHEEVLSGATRSADRDPFPRGDGRIDWVRWEMRPWYAADDVVGGALLFSETVNDLVEAERTAEQTIERHGLALDTAEIGTWDLDLTTDQLTWSDRTKAAFGISPGVACTMRDFYAGLHPDDLEATSAAFASALDPDLRMTYDVEYRTIGKEDGLIRWVAAKGKGLFDEEGRCVRAIGTAIDITDRKAAEARQALLLKIADRLRQAGSAKDAIQDATALLAGELDADTVGYIEILGGGEARVISGTGRGLRAFSERKIEVGAGRGPFRGAGISDLIAGRSFVVNDVRADPRTAPVADHILQETGSTAVIQTPMMRGKTIGAILFIRSARPRDWTADEVALVEAVAARTWEAVERARAEEALREANERLAFEVAAAVAQRETALSQLHQAQKLETIGQLTGGIAHDFNNLLTPITGALDLIQRKLADEPRLARLADGALQSADRARILVQRLLGFARRQALERVALDLCALLEGMRDLIASSTGRTVEVRIDCAPDLPLALADPNQLELALLNLCVNARDAMPHGGALTIAAAAATAKQGGRLAAGEYVRLSVTDSGIGMDEETLKHAIEPFFSTKTKGRGTGLGLSMVHGLAAQLGGDFILTSTPDAGTTAELWLPVAPSGTPAPVHLPTAAPVALRPLAILLVDDEDLVRAGTAEMLRELGHTVAEASGGAEALTRLGTGLEFDAVITDYMMPRMDGIALAERIRETRPDMPVLLVTGYMGLADGASDLPRLAKPFRRADLAGRLAELVGDPVRDEGA